MAERFKAVVLKTIDVRASAGSNPVSSVFYFIFERKTMLNFLVDVITLGAAIFVGSVAFDWYRKRNL